MNEISKEYPKNSGPVPNIINDEWSKRLKGNEFKIVFLIARKTFGFRKEWDKISISQMAKYTGLSERTCQRVRKALVEVGAILCKGTAGGISADCCEYKINLGWQFVTRDNLPPVTNEGSRGDKMAPAGVTAETPTKFTIQNSQSQNTQSAGATENPLNVKRSGIPKPISEQLDRIENLSGRKIHRGSLLVAVNESCMVIGEQAVCEALQGIGDAYENPQQDRQMIPGQLVKLLRDPDRMSYWASRRKKPSESRGWWTGKTDHEIITRLVSLLKIGNDIDPAIAHLIPLAKERAAQPMERIAV